MDHSFTYNYTSARLYLVSVHQMVPPQTEAEDISNCSLLFIYLPQKDERLNWPSWLTYSGCFTHISGHLSAAGRAQDGTFAGQRPTFYHCTTQPTF